MFLAEVFCFKKSHFEEKSQTKVCIKKLAQMLVIENSLCCHESCSHALMLPFVSGIWTYLAKVVRLD